MKGEMPLRCEESDGAIDIGIGREVLKFAAENCPDLWNGYDPDVPAVKITDAGLFAKEVAAEINREDEDGSTFLTRMLDQAILAAVENGCEGVDHDA